MVESADTTDSKSVAPRACGFKSHRSYHYKKGESMIYTAVFQNKNGDYAFETRVATHDRVAAWRDLHESRPNDEYCLVLLIDGQASVKTYADILDSERE